MTAREVPALADDTCRMRLLAFLLVKTAPVRSGVKPAELLRVRHCYRAAEGLCLYRRDVYAAVGLDYIELKTEASASLVLFYDRDALARTLSARHNRAWLERHGYDCATVESALAELKRRAQGDGLPHEVGVFIGYPLKDVVGFMMRLPSVPRTAPWRIYGAEAPSLALMTRYAAEESRAAAALAEATSLSHFKSLLIPAA